MDWTEIKITVDTKDIDTAGDIANMVDHSPIRETT